MKNENYAITKLQFHETEIRTVLHHGETWWVAKDVCEVLEHTNPTEALKSLDEDEKNTLRLPEGIRAGNPSFNIVNEAGLYHLILKSQTPSAKAFRRWVTHEVLPQIHRQGFYLNPKASAEVKQLRSLELRCEAMRKRIEVKALEGRAREIITVEDSIPIVDWIHDNIPDLDNKRAANLSRAIKRALLNNLQRPVGTTPKFGGKIMTALLEDIEEAVELLREHRSELPPSDS